jgi:hypothetical protein
MADLSSQIRLLKQQLFAAGSVSISLRPGASGVLKLSELEEDATYQEPFQQLMVDASGRRWLTHTDESEWIKVFDAPKNLTTES